VLVPPVVDPPERGAPVADGALVLGDVIAPLERATGDPIVVALPGEDLGDVSAVGPLPELV
jgi:hypothetical protein